MKYNHVKIVRQGNKVILPPGMTYNTAIEVLLEKKKRESVGIDKVKCTAGDVYRNVKLLWQRMLRPQKQKDAEKRPSYYPI